MYMVRHNDIADNMIALYTEVVKPVIYQIIALC